MKVRKICFLLSLILLHVSMVLPSWSADLDCSTPAGILTCNSSVTGDTATRGLSNVSTYSCTGRSMTGKELVYQFTNPELQDLVITLSDLVVDLDVMLLGSCDEADCLAWGDTEICYPQLSPGI